MIPVRDNLVSDETPILTWTLIALNAGIYLWDRGGGLTGGSVAFADLTMRPIEVTMAIKSFFGGPGIGDSTELGKIFTAMFLHGSLAHLIGNLLFLQAFGPSVERALGGFRFALYYLFWGFVASAAHIFVDPMSRIPTLGASGAIGGVLGCYFLLFPSSRIKFIIPPLFFWPFVIQSWILLGLWFVWQILFPQPGVANWAHAGGFMAGMMTVLVMGGRAKILKESPIEVDKDFDDD